MDKVKKNLAGAIVAVCFLLLVGFVFCGNLRPLFSAAKTFITTKDLSAVSDGFETRYNDTFPQKSIFIDMNGLTCRLMQRRMLNEIVLMDNGHASQIVEERPEEVLHSQAQEMNRFSKWLEERDIDFLYVQLPHKNAQNDPHLPEGINDYSNQIADTYLSYLNGVDVLDIRDSIENDGIDRYSLFLKSEHHWSPYGAFYGFQKVCHYLEDNYGYDIDPMVLDIENYQVEMLAKKSVGYYGQRAGIYFAGTDDFPLLYPRFHTDQTCSILHKDVVRSGTFYDAVFDLSYSESTQRHMGLYGTYVGGDYPIVIHESKTAKNPGTVLVIMDSYGNTLSPYLSTVFQEVIAIDSRRYNPYGYPNEAWGTTEDMVELYDPDVVLVMVNPNQMGIAGMRLFEYGT